MEQIEHTPVHRSLVRPVLLGGAERAPAIVNATTMLGIGLGPGFHWPNILLGAFLGTAVHMLLRWMAKRDPQFFAVYLRHLSYQPDYRHFADPDAPPARVYRSVEPYKRY
jgi:type IV secretion system protein VirB3